MVEQDIPNILIQVQVLDKNDRQNEQVLLYNIIQLDNKQYFTFLFEFDDGSE